MTKPKHMGGLGFRDIELFNLALLARQARRIVQDPSSLSAPIIKAVYFPNQRFLEAELGQSPSRIWRSIIDGRDVLERGLIKRIGTGEGTNIWNTNWLPRNGLLRPVECVLRDPPQNVCELIDQVSVAWDTKKVKAAFLPMDVEAILNIPICTRRQDDFWAWHYDKNGLFSVRSAYRMLVNTKERRTAWLVSSAAASKHRGEEKS